MDQACADGRMWRFLWKLAQTGSEWVQIDVRSSFLERRKSLVVNEGGIFTRDNPVLFELNFALRTRADVQSFQTPDRNTATLES